MNRNQLYKEILLIVLLGFITNLAAIVHKPMGNEENIKLEIRGKERIYYELDDDGLFYRNIGKQFNSGDSIQIGIYSRTIKAPTGKKKRNYGYSSFSSIFFLFMNFYSNKLFIFFLIKPISFFFLIFLLSYFLLNTL